jgi:poly(3-hydroxybutyrate) depolymerase
MPTTAYGGACGVTDEPYIGKCGFEAAHAILDWIYSPDVAPPRTAPTPTGRFIEFDQRGYIPETGFFSYLWGTGLDKTGWLYVPSACEAGEPCRLHVVFHGCKQGQSFLPLRPPPDGGLYNGTTFVRNTGYDRWADTNRLVVLFPQAVSIPWKNPNGCWDWWGFTDDGYATRDGIQIRTVRAMIDHLASARRD